MKRILGSLVLAFMMVSMLTACGSSDQASPVLYDLFDTYESSSFPQLPWISYTRTLNDSWTADHWSIANDGSANYWAYLYYPNLDLTSIQNSAFINNNYNKTNVDCSINARMSITSPNNNNVQLGLILRASGSDSEHYAFIYTAVASVVYDTVTFTAVNTGMLSNSITLVFNGTDDLDTVVGAWNTANPGNMVGFTGQAGTYIPTAGTATLATTLTAATVEIQKVDNVGAITVLGAAPVTIYVWSGVFDPTVLHTYRFSVSGTTTLTFTAYIDGYQQLPAIYNPADGSTVTPACNPITDDGTVLHGNGLAVYHSGEPGFFVENANTASIYRFSIWEP